MESTLKKTIKNIEFSKGESYESIALKYNKQVKDIKRVESKYILLN